jgi:molecular chaperone GrpE
VSSGLLEPDEPFAEGNGSEDDALNDAENTAAEGDGSEDDARNQLLAEAMAAAGLGADEPVGGAVSDESLPPTPEALLAERTADLQRLQAEYANYKKRVDRDRANARQLGIEAVVRDLLPVIDAIEAAETHGELTDGFKLVATELKKVCEKYGVELYGEAGDLFDPNIHEALMQVPSEEPVAEPTVTQVMQHGVKLNGRVLRPARVGVANPE